MFQIPCECFINTLATAKPLDLLNVIHKCSFEEAYPNTNIALRIFLTLPVTVASCELSFSKLKLIQNYLCSSMGQYRLENGYDIHRTKCSKQPFL